MPSNYTGNPVGVQAPSAAPGPGVLPVGALPVDGDPANAASVAQPFKVPLDFLAFLAAMPTFGPWGYSVTDATISADTDLITGNAFYRNLTIQAGKTLTMLHPGILFVSGTLNIANTGKLYFGLASSQDGNNASSSTRGTGGVGWNGDTFGQILGGGNGGHGGDDTHIAPIAGLAAGAVIDGGGGSGLGGSAGGGGNGQANGAAAGAFSDWFSGSPNAYFNAQELQTILMNGGWGFARAGTESARVPLLFGLMGGAGGGGGGGANVPGNSAGGGGGAGGALGLVIARNIIIAADGAITAPGGNGGNAFAGTVAAGGGGAGGGGSVNLIYAGRSGPALTAAACVPPGTAGTGANGGAAGGAGANGSVNEFLIGY